MFFTENTKEITVFTEDINAREFLQEMVDIKYTGENLTFAKALQEALNNDTLVELSEENHQNLSEEVALMEDRLEELKEICSLNEAFRVSKKAKDLDGAIALALKECNATAKEKGYKPVKSKSELSKLELFVAKAKTSMSLDGYLRKVTNFSMYKEKTIGGQLVILDTGVTSVRSAKAIYTNSDGSKVKTISVKFHKYLDRKGEMKK